MSMEVSPQGLRLRGGNWGTRIDGLARCIGQLSGAKRAGLAVVAGAISVLAFAPVHFWPVLFLSFGALVWLLDGCDAYNQGFVPKLRCAAITGFWFGFGYFLTGLYWVAEAFLVEPWRHGWLLPFAMTLLPGGMALFYAGACALAIWLWRPGAARVFALAIAFGLAEYVRGHVLTGLPWNLTGYGLAANLPAMQLSALFGAYALSLLAVLFFASPFAIFAPNGPGSTHRRDASVLAACLLAAYLAGVFWGDRRLAAATAANTEIAVRVVQANVDQANKWRPENAGEIFDDYLTLTRSAGGPKKQAGVSLVVWPETAVPFLLGDSPEALAAIAEALPPGTQLIVGSPRIEPARDPEGDLVAQRIYNSLFVIDEAGKVSATYDKIHLVPFGEFLPFQDFMESLGLMQLTGIRGGFSKGKGPRLLDVKGAPAAGPLICYEIIFPEELVDAGTRPGWLLNLTNDAWFGTSAGPYQHFHQARLRAIEQGLPVLRAANTGISAIVDPYGRVRGEIGLGREGILDSVLPEALTPTPFVLWGRWIELSVFLLALSGWAAARRRS
jgi:apolipoprotein N-acyltransferase